MAEDYSYVGRGRVYIKVKGAADGYREVGNCTALNFSPAEDVTEQLDYQVLGGGKLAESRRISSVTSSMTLSNFSADNLADALLGSTTEETAGTETDEMHTAYHDRFIALNKVLDTITDVNDAAGGLGTSYVEGVDYELRPNGILVLSTGSIVDGGDLYFTYTTSLADIVQALTIGNQEYQFYFDGLNDAKSGKSVLITVYRLKLGVTSTLDLIADEFGTLTLPGELLKDTTITGAGLSQYFTIQVEQ